MVDTNEIRSETYMLYSMKSEDRFSNTTHLTRKLLGELGSGVKCDEFEEQSSHFTESHLFQ